jgi:hypothetical protein
MRRLHGSVPRSSETFLRLATWRTDPLSANRMNPAPSMASHSGRIWPAASASQASRSSRRCHNSSDAAASPPDTWVCPGFCPCYTVSPRNRCGRHAGLEALRRDRLLLLKRPLPSRLATGDQFDAGIASTRTTARTSALWLLGWWRVGFHEPNAAYLQAAPLSGTETTLAAVSQNCHFQRLSASNGYFSNSPTLLADRHERKTTVSRRTANEERKRISDRLPRSRTMLLQGRRAQLRVGCARPPRRPISCRRHAERGFEQSAEMGGIIETPPLGYLGYGGPGIRSVQFGSATQETSPSHPP